MADVKEQFYVRSLLACPEPKTRTAADARVRLSSPPEIRAKQLSPLPANG
jgi:hypothetical protein